MSIPSERAKTPPGGVSVVPEVDRFPSSIGGVNVVPQRERAPSPKGVGLGVSTLQPAETSTLKRSSPDLPPSKAIKIDEPASVPELQPVVAPLPKMSEEEKQVFRDIYKTLATGSLSKLLDIDPANSWWELSKQFGSFTVKEAPSLVTQVKEVKAKSERVKDVHPLSFLLFVSQEKDMQIYLRELKQKGEPWNQYVDKLKAWIEQLPWPQTVEDIGKNIQKHQVKGTLQLESFLAAMPQDKRAALTRRINEKRYTDLCEGIIGLK